MSNILNAKIVDSFKVDGTASNPDFSTFSSETVAADSTTENPDYDFTGMYQSAETGVLIKVNFGDYNDVAAGFGTTYFHGQNDTFGDGAIESFGGAFFIKANDGYTVAAANYKWNSGNVEAITSDGTLSSNVIDDIEFYDTTQGGAEGNRVGIIVRWKDTFKIPTGTGNYVVMIDIMDDPGAQLAGTMFTTLAIINDFADCFAQQYNSEAGTFGTIPSGIDGDNFPLNVKEFDQSQWDEAFHRRKPLKYRGVVSNPHGSDINIESVTFTPATDIATGNDVFFFDTREFHTGGEARPSAVINSEAYGVNAAGSGTVNGSHFTDHPLFNGTRKDVIYVGATVQEGVSVKLGTIKLKLQQDIYSVKDKSNGELAMMGPGTALSVGAFAPEDEGWYSGQVEYNGRTNGWHSKYNVNSDVENFMTYAGAGIGNFEWRPGGYTGLVPSGRVDPSNTDSSDDNDYLLGAEDYTPGETLPSQSRAILPDLGYWHTLKEFLTSQDEMLPLYESPYTYTPFGHPGYDLTGMAGPLLDTGSTVLAAMDNDDTYIDLEQDINEYLANHEILDFVNGSPTPFILNKMYRSLSYWTKALYIGADLHPWAFFPNFGNGSLAYDSSSTPTSGSQIINMISPGVQYGGTVVNRFTLDNFVLRPWAHTHDTLNAGEGYPSVIGLIESASAPDSLTLDGSEGWAFIQAWHSTFSYLENYYREVSFDIYYTHTVGASEDLGGSPGVDVGFNVDGTQGANMSMVDPFGYETDNNSSNAAYTQYAGPWSFSGSEQMVGLSCNIKWDYIPWKTAIDLGAPFFSENLLSEGGRSLRKSTSVSAPSANTLSVNSAKEIREVNLSLGSTLGSAEEEIIGPGGISHDADATVQVVGDKGAKFEISFLKKNEVAYSAGDDEDTDLSNPRSAGGESLVDKILDGGEYEFLDEKTLYTIPKDGSVTLKIPTIEPFTKDKGWVEFALSVRPRPTNHVEESDTDIGVDDTPSEDLKTDLVCYSELDTLPLGSIYHQTLDHGALPGCDRTEVYMVYPPGYFSLNENDVSMLDGIVTGQIGNNTTTVIRSTAKKVGDTLLSPNSSNAILTKRIFQLPYVSIGFTATKDSDWIYESGKNISDISTFGFKTKNVGKPFGFVKDITFIPDSEKSVSFDIRVKKTGTFSLKEDILDEFIELQQASYNNSTNIDHPRRFDVAVGMIVIGDGIPVGATVTSVTSSTRFVISSSTTGGELKGETLSLKVPGLTETLFEPLVKGNNEVVQFTKLTAHVGNGLSNTDNDYATFTGRITYIKFGRQSQTFNVDLTKIFEHTV